MRSSLDQNSGKARRKVRCVNQLGIRDGIFYDEETLCLCPPSAREVKKRIWEKIKSKRCMVVDSDSQRNGPGNEYGVDRSSPVALRF